MALPSLQAAALPAAMWAEQSTPLPYGAKDSACAASPCCWVRHWADPEYELAVPHRLAILRGHDVGKEVL